MQIAAWNLVVLADLAGTASSSKLGLVICSAAVKQTSVRSAVLVFVCCLKCNGQQLADVAALVLLFCISSCVPLWCCHRLRCSAPQAGFNLRLVLAGKTYFVLKTRLMSA
jgi:hypothetical protein